MSDFYISIKPALKNEGGFNKNLGDGAGWTYRGITKKYDPDWYGWSWLNNYVMTYGFPKEETVFPELESLVLDYYKNKYWGLAKGDQLTNQAMADFVLSMFMAHGQAAAIINGAINDAMGSAVVPENNTFTATAVSYLNQYPERIYPVLYDNRWDYFRSLSNWNQYKDSWTRLMSFYPATIGSGSGAAGGSFGLVGMAAAALGLYFILR